MEWQAAMPLDDIRARRVGVAECAGSRMRNAHGFIRFFPNRTRHRPFVGQARRIEKTACVHSDARVWCAPFVIATIRKQPCIQMTHRFHIANLPAPRPSGCGQAAFAPAYRPCRGDRKEVLPINC